MKVGDTAPTFTLPGTDGETIEQYSLTDSLEDGPTVLAFYPFDFSPLCTNQLCSFRNAVWLTFTEGVDVWGISPDSAFSHRAYSNEHDFRFPLLSDGPREVTDEFGLLLEEYEQHKSVPRRAIVAIDGSRTVRYRWAAADTHELPTTEIIESATEWFR